MKYRLLALTVTLALLSSCQPGQQLVPTTRPSARPTPVPTASSKPSATPTPTATATAAQPSATPTPTPATPTPTATPTPEATPTPTPVPTTGDLEVLIYDENHRTVDKSSVEVLSLDSSKPYDVSVNFEEDGRGILKDVPAGVTLEVTATAPGYNKQQRLIVLDPGKTYNLVFEDDFSISSKPEIIAVEPGFPASVGVFDPIVLVFNENMDQESVADALALQLDDEDDSRFDVGTVMPGYESIIARPDDSIYDQTDFDLSWDTGRRLIIKPKHGWPVGSAKSFRLLLSYRDENGEGGEITDNSGNPAREADDGDERNDGPFRIGNRYEPYLPVTVSRTGLPDTRLSDAFADNGSSDTITMRFSRELHFDITTGDVVEGGATGSTSSALAATDEVSAQEAVENYELVCDDEVIDWPGGSAAVFTDTDEVRITAPGTLFETGQHCTITIESGLDAFGKRIQNADDDFSVP
ncbi:MAG: carboxypeptidase-like regulatory domain-containing protein [Candidatus Sericytochromatia bacterium]